MNQLDDDVKPNIQPGMNSRKQSTIPNPKPPLRTFNGEIECIELSSSDDESNKIETVEFDPSQIQLYAQVKAAEDARSGLSPNAHTQMNVRAEDAPSHRPAAEATIDGSSAECSPQNTANNGAAKVMHQRSPRDKRAPIGNYTNVGSSSGQLANASAKESLDGNYLLAFPPSSNQSAQFANVPDTQREFQISLKQVHGIGAPSLVDQQMANAVANSTFRPIVPRSNNWASFRAKKSAMQQQFTNGGNSIGSCKMHSASVDEPGQTAKLNSSSCFLLDNQMRHHQVNGSQVMRQACPKNRHLQLSRSSYQGEPAASPNVQQFKRSVSIHKLPPFPGATSLRHPNGVLRLGQANQMHTSMLARQTGNQYMFNTSQPKKICKKKLALARRAAQQAGQSAQLNSGSFVSVSNGARCFVATHTMADRSLVRQSVPNRNLSHCTKKTSNRASMFGTARNGVYPGFSQRTSPVGQTHSKAGLTVNAVSSPHKAGAISNGTAQTKKVTKSPLTVNFKELMNKAETAATRKLTTNSVFISPVQMKRTGLEESMDIEEEFLLSNNIEEDDVSMAEVREFEEDEEEEYYEATPKPKAPHHKKSAKRKPPSKSRRFRCTYGDCTFIGRQQINVMSHIRKNHFHVPHTKKAQMEAQIFDPEDVLQYVLPL